MDRLIVERKLDAQDVLVLNLSRAVQVCVDLGAHLLADLALPPPDTMGETFDRLAQAELIDVALAARKKKKAVGFRNIAVHAYDSIDWHIVFAIASGHLTDFRDFAAAVVVHMRKV